MALAERLRLVCDPNGSGPSGDGDADRQGGRPCPMCEEPMYSRHCKYVCPNHGVVMDCSDVFWTE